MPQRYKKLKELSIGEVKEEHINKKYASGK